MEYLKRDIFLLGMPGCGKSTLGTLLASRLQRTFVDLDQYIEEKTQLTISEIFSRKGEDEFRQLESRWLRALPENKTPLVIATGGGTPCFGDNMNYINDRGISIFMEVPEQVLADRLRSTAGDRPLLKGLTDRELTDFLSTLLAKRKPFYKKALLVLTGVEITVNQTIQSLQSLKFHS